MINFIYRRKFYITLIAIIILLSIFTLQSYGTHWYIDNTAKGNGTSWALAWNSFADIQWDLIKPGDILYISGGKTSAQYSDQLFIKNVNGNSNSPIIIRVGQNPGHNGDVIITNKGPHGGIKIQNSSYIIINGDVNGVQKIKVQNCSVSGIFISSGKSHHIKLTYLDINNNGDQSDEDGIVIKHNDDSYPLAEISFCKIHSNWQDQIKCYSGGYKAGDFGSIKIHHNEIYNIHDDGFEAGAGSIDFYNNEMHTRSARGGKGHSDGLQFYGEYYRIYNNIFRNFNHKNLSSTAYIYIHTGFSKDNQRPAKEIYIYNNLLYEDQIFSSRSALRGISFAPQKKTTPSISNILIANNTIVGMPAHGISLKFTQFNPGELKNIMIVNNLIHNCYTNGGGQAMNIISDINTIFHAYPLSKNKKNPGITKGDFFISQSGKAFDISDIIIDYNLISKGKNGSDKIGFCGHIVTMKIFTKKFHLNISGITSDPSLNKQLKPDNKKDPGVDSGLNLFHFFKEDIEGNKRPHNADWDIGAYEF